MSDPAQPEETVTALVQPSVAEQVFVTSDVTAVVADEVTPTGADKAVDETTSEEKKEEKPVPKEMTEGYLSKAHGGLLALFKQKRYFYFQDESIPEDKLRTYLHKDTASTSTAAYASQTGKGLLLYSKIEGQKVPHGIIKLADVTDVAPSGNSKFILKLASNELHLESTVSERDSWVFTINHKIAEAKAIDDDVTNSEGYKASLGKLTKPIAAGPAKAQEKSLESKEPEARDTDPKPERTDIALASGDVEEEPTCAEKKTEPGRSLSKKNKKPRFPFLEKKKKPEEKKEESKDGEEETAVDTKPNEPGTALEVATDADVESKEISYPDEAGKSSEPVVVSKPPKRNSLFSTLFDKKEKEVAEEKKDDIKNDILEPPETVTTVAQPTEACAETPVSEKTGTATASSPPKQHFFSLFDKREKASTSKIPDKEIVIKATEAGTSTAETAEAAEEPVETAPVVTGDMCVVDSISPATSPKEQRRKSFFSFNKRDKKPEEVKSDSEDAEPAQKSSPTLTTQKPGLITGLIRKASKATRNATRETDSKDIVAPETVGEEPASALDTAEDPDKTDTTATPATATPTTAAVGDVAPEPAQAPVQTPA